MIFEAWKNGFELIMPEQGDETKNPLPLKRAASGRDQATSAAEGPTCSLQQTPSPFLRRGEKKSSHISSRSRGAVRCKTRPPSAPLAEAAVDWRRRLIHAASSRLISASNSKRSCAPSSSGSQFVIWGKMVR